MPAARSTHRLAKSLFASKYAAASSVASRARQRPEIDGRERAGAGAGAPGVVERIALDARGHDQDGRAHGDRGGKARQVVKGGLVRPVHVLDREQERGTRAGLAHQRRDRLALAAAARRAVHGVVQRTQLGRLRQVEQVVEEDAAIDERRVGGYGVLERGPGGCQVAAGAQPEQAAHQRPDRVLPGAGAEVEHQAEMTGETLGYRLRLELLDQARLADSRLAANDDRLAGAVRATGAERGPEPGELDAPADEWPILGRGLAEAEQAPRPDRLGKALDLQGTRLHGGQSLAAACDVPRRRSE